MDTKNKTQIRLPIRTDREGYVQYLGKQNKGSEQLPTHIAIVDSNKRIIAGYFIPPEANKIVREGIKVDAGSEIASRVPLKNKKTPSHEELVMN
jgi:hypothetical protein